MASLRLGVNLQAYTLISLTVAMMWTGQYCYTSWSHAHAENDPPEETYHCQCQIVIIDFDHACPLTRTANYHPGRKHGRVLGNHEERRQKGA